MTDYLFTREDYLHVNSDVDILNFNHEDSFINYVIKNSVAYCPYQSSFSLFSGKLHIEIIFKFIESLKGKVTKVSFTLPPLFYLEAKDQLNVLLDAGFKITRIEIAQFIPEITNLKSGLNAGNKNLINKKDQIEIETRQLSINELDECYEMLLENSHLKGYSLTMTKERVHLLMKTFPSHFLLYGTYLKGELIATSVSIRISNQILYQYAWAHKEDYKKLSPLVYHNYFLSQELGTEVKQFDLGVSSLEGKINRGIFRFKKNLGASFSKKYYLEYNF